jgi:hypothetical protein
MSSQPKVCGSDSGQAVSGPIGLANVGGEAIVLVPSPDEDRGYTASLMRGAAHNQDRFLDGEPMAVRVPYEHADPYVLLRRIVGELAAGRTIKTGAPAPMKTVIEAKSGAERVLGISLPAAATA